MFLTCRGSPHLRSRQCMAPATTSLMIPALILHFPNHSFLLPRCLYCFLSRSLPLVLFGLAVLSLVALPRYARPSQARGITFFFAAFGLLFMASFSRSGRGALIRLRSKSKEGPTCVSSARGTLEPDFLNATE